MRNAFVNALFKIAKKDRNLVLFTGDLGFGVLTKFWEELPEQFVNAGICEQNMASMAAGAALEGKTCFIYSIGNFPTMRCLEQIRNDIAYHEANVKIVSIADGFVYGSLGVSHHSTEDIAIMRAIPGMTVFTPCDPAETQAVIKAAHKLKGPCYIRIGKGGEKTIHEDCSGFLPGKAYQLRKGSGTAIFACGSIASEAYAASVELEKKGVRTAVYSFPTVKPIDRALIRESAGKYRTIITLEEHNLSGGFGSAVSEVLCETGGALLVRAGVNDLFTPVAGSQKYLRGLYGIDAAAMVKLVLKHGEKKRKTAK